MPRPNLYLAVSQAAPKTWGEGYLAGREEGYEQGRRDRGLQLVVIGFFGGVIALAGLLLVLR